ncbi:M4 family metallopeptidase [Ornithinimicrobium sp. Arc0846-15]|uniref:M4 family metallopeptidase n=1 Tax=Ornithinimicrobium sp. INDO-MA30-4 TaxID=2908651 RepID=UPI001C66D9A9|nr:M4 family metallopeptidase [Ornithinimicrobium sp. INDO-MA30-4]MBW8171529.1 M4 family metallopeptidase [Ornithinimicrobium laminariae]UJH70887.1 M4 family metallopeptidase [Ornithinimicrobium sp. INDO-MA30-4]
MNTPRHCGFVPDYLLARIANADPQPPQGLLATVDDQSKIRSRREVRATRWVGGRPPLPESAVATQSAADSPAREIYDALSGIRLPGVLVRLEGAGPTDDQAVTDAYDGLGLTWSLLFEQYGRRSLDDTGMELLATVHYGRDYDNAFWDGSQMVFGDGDGVYFEPFTASLDVIGHELTHGLIQFTAGLVYVAQPGALNESISDVFGSLVRQRALDQTANEADWLVGADILTDAVAGDGLRSLKAPGTAYDDPILGVDPQPAHMRDYADLPHDESGDNGGVHINSGIPNHAFYLAATRLGGTAWDQAGQVWFDVLSTPGMIAKDASFQDFAAATVRAAEGRFGVGGDVAGAVASGWRDVGLEVTKS